MIIKGSRNIKNYLRKVHMQNREAWYERHGYEYSANEVGDHDEDYVFDALFDTPNT